MRTNLLVNGNFFKDKDLIPQIKISVSQRLYNQEIVKVCYNMVDFIEKVLKEELDLIENYKRGNADYYAGRTTLEIN